MGRNSILARNDKKYVIVVTDTKAYGIIEHISKGFFYFEIKEEPEKKYTKINKSEIGTEHFLLSDISTGFWRKEKWKKIDTNKDIEKINLNVAHLTSSGLMI